MQFKKNIRLMGNQFEFTLIDENENNANETFEIAIQEIKRIETLFSQLCDQFKIRNNYAKSFQGFKTRILAKITALTLVQFINKFIFERPINNIKTQII